MEKILSVLHFTIFLGGFLLAFLNLHIIHISGEVSDENVNPAVIKTQYL